MALAGTSALTSGACRFIPLAVLWLLFFCRGANAVDGPAALGFESEGRHGARDERYPFSMSVHVKWRIFPENVRRSDQLVPRRCAQRQRLAGKQA